MSFILDALRKSEHARERRTLPGLADVPVAHAQRPRVPRFLIVLGALLAVNLLVLLVVLLRPAHDAAAGPGSSAPGSANGGAGSASGANGASASGATVRPVAPAPTGPLPDGRTAGTRDVRSLQDEAGGGVDDAPPPYVEPPPVRRDPTLDSGARVQRSNDPIPVVPDGVQTGLVPKEFLVDANAPPPRPTRNASAASRSGSGPASNTGTGATYGNAGSTAQTYGVPSINDLAPQATAGLPTLAISLHVYGSQPADRFVVLNGRRYQEGAQLQEGPTLERITTDGVILNHRGLRFLLPRQ